MPARRSHRLAFTAALALLTPASLLHAHGTMETPVSRVYNCYLENPENPKSAACRAAVAAGGTQEFYDWNGINRLDANGQHRAIIPDGKLCSAGKPGFAGLDLARTDWPAKTLAPDANGNYEFVFLATAPHATRTIEFYVTRNGYDPSRPLKWSDLDAAPFATFTGGVPLVNSRYHLTAKLPQGKTGSHVVFSIWQRADSTEAFYSCSDVVFGPSIPATWRDIGALRAQSALPVGTIVTFRLFAPGGGNALSIPVTLAAGETATTAWPYTLATAVNAQTSLVRIGILQTDGTIVPAPSATANTVYVANAGYTFAVDTEQPSGGGSGGGGSGGNAQYDYPAAIGSYQAGTVVRGTDQKLYQCRPYPNSGWCNQAPAYYAPGTGLAWSDAWTRLP